MTDAASERMIAFAAGTLGLPPGARVALSQLGGRGSDRTYFRLRWGDGHSAILVHYDAKRVENGYFADIALFLRRISVAAPRVMRHDGSRCLILMEDLGETDLWSCRESPWETRRDLYRKTLTVVHTLHSFPAEAFPSQGVRLMEPFGPGLYRWERDYFTTHFVRGVCGIELPGRAAEGLEEELSALAGRLAGDTVCLLHRDLQSQNVMIRDDTPYLIDFQGMRFGNPLYDLGSLLCDPYVPLAETEREELLSFASELWQGRGYDAATFRRRFWEASAQRLMQALGAYGFLGLGKGLKAYLAHIPAGLANLRLAAAKAGSLPELEEVVDLCGERITNYKL